MSERCTQLMARADRQLSEMIEFFGTLDEADLRKPCPHESAEDSAEDTVGAVAAHTAEGYHHLGRFLQSTGYVQGSPATGNNHDHDQRPCLPPYGHAPSPEALRDIRDRLTGGKIPVGLLADLTDQQLDSLPPAGSSRFSDGRWTLELVIDAVIAHQAAHLATLKRAVGMTHPSLVAESAKNGDRQRLISEHRLESIVPIAITTSTTMRDEGHAHG